MNIRSPFDGLRIPAEVVFKFFGVFSRFEFVLKKKGFLMPKKRAEANWHRFGREAAQWLVIEPGSELEAAIAYLDEHAPKVQMLDLSWQAQALCGGTATARALDAIRRVRNNLFHGGKHTRESRPGHDEKLVRYALVVLIACLEQNQDLREIFEQNEF